MNASPSTGHTQRGQPDGTEPKPCHFLLHLHLMPQYGFGHPRKLVNFKQIRPKVCKTVAYKEISALYVLRPSKLMAVTRVKALTPGRINKTLYKEFRGDGAE